LARLKAQQTDEAFMSRPLALTDTQLDIVFRLAAPLFDVDRASFLEDVAKALAGLPEVGDGIVARTCAQVQRKYWRPPIVERVPSRWNRNRPDFEKSSRRAY
jgi:hypothetical protein